MSRRRTIGPDRVKLARQLYRGGMTARQTAAELGCSVSIVKLIMRGKIGYDVPDAGAEPNPRASYGERSAWTRLTADAVREIRRKHALGASQASLCREYEITACPMHHIIHGITWQRGYGPPGTDFRHGPYRVERWPVGMEADCAIYGRSRVHEISDTPMPWPLSRDGYGSYLRPIVTGGLERAIRTERSAVVCWWWGVSRRQVVRWRQKLRIDRGSCG